MSYSLLLPDDHPRIAECNNRYGIDLAQSTDDGTFSIRSANMTSMPEFYDSKARRGTERPPNYFVDREGTRLCIALSPQNVCELFQLSTKQDALRAIQQAFNSYTHCERDSDCIPIRVQSKHVFWGEPCTLTRDKMEFTIRNTVVAEAITTVDDASKKRARCDEPTTCNQRHGRVTYNGVTYDDDDEARHAYLMDCLDVKYRTQPTNIQHPLLLNETNSTGIYRTDFFVPSIDAYLETTGSEPSARKHFTCELLARHAFYEGRTVYLVYGGLHPPRRDTYTADGTQTMKIIKYVVEPHTFANGREELVVVAEDGYAWMYKNGTYVIDKLGSIMNRAWDHPSLRAAITMARHKVF